MANLILSVISLQKSFLRATNCYNTSQIFVEGRGYKLYKGSLKDRPIFVKKYDNHSLLGDFATKDIAIGSQMSVHKNVLKVLGCCLETQIPTIVYEFDDTKSLSTFISATDVKPLPWKCRLKIATGIANAVAYLHNAFSRPVIHREIKCSNVILDQNNVPKLIDFGLCISIPEGQSHVKEDIRGRTWWVAPEYWDRGYMTEKFDVYQFGILLIELLSGQQASYLMLEHETLDLGQLCVEELINATDNRIKNEGTYITEQLLDFATLILRCISSDEGMPTMIEVAQELRRIDQSFPSPC